MTTLRSLGVIVSINRVLIFRFGVLVWFGRSTTSSFAGICWRWEKCLFWWLIHNYVFFPSEVLTSPERTREGCLGHRRTARLSSAKKWGHSFLLFRQNLFRGRVGDTGIQTCFCFRDTYCAGRQRCNKRKRIFTIKMIS